MYSLGKRSGCVWSLVTLRKDGDIMRDAVVVRGPVREKHRLFFETATKNKRIVLFSSYTTFPDPRGYCSDPGDEFIDVVAEKGDDIVAWCHCFRDAESMPVPATVPRIFISESDLSPALDTLRGMELVEKTHDFIAYLPSGSWNERVRNVAVAVDWLSFIATTMRLRVLVVGDGGRFAPPVDQVDFLPQDEFWERLRRSKALFVASTFDASPKILTEALSLDVPILVNKDIVGGWKYVTPQTGMFFDPGEKKKDRLRSFLAKRFTPRRYAAEHLDPAVNGRWFSERLSGILDRRFEDLPIDGVLFINLEERGDRLQSLLSELSRMGVNDAVRVEAVRERLNGHLGCARSHVRALDEAARRGWKRFIVLEDDFRFGMRRERWLHVVSEFFRTVERWDVLVLGYCSVRWADEAATSVVRRVTRSTCTVGYVVNEGYAATLQKNFEESVRLLEAEPVDRQVFVTDNAIDQRWGGLQANDYFYGTAPPLGTSSGSWSSIMRKTTR